jgi:hypothetical protein
MGYQPRGTYLPTGGPRAVGMYPMQPASPRADLPYGGGPGLGVRYPNPPMLTSTRVGYHRLISQTNRTYFIAGNVTE